MEFQMRFRHSHGNLHIETMGGFDESAAEKLLQLVRRECPVGGRIFIDTTGVDSVYPSGRHALNVGLGVTLVPPSSLFFKGEKGFQVAPSGSRVIVMSRKAHERGISAETAERPKHRCCGKCAHCTCHGHEDEGVRPTRDVPS